MTYPALALLCLAALISTASAGLRVPDPPEAVSASSGASGTAVVVFTPAPDDDYEGTFGDPRYRVSAHAGPLPAAGSTDGAAVATVVVGAPPAYVLGLADGSEVYFTVKGENGVGEVSPEGDVARSGLVTVGSPGSIPHVEAVASNEAVLLIWEPPTSLAGPISSYTVTTEPADVPVITLFAEAQAGGGSATNHSVSIGGLTNSQGYTFSVVAHNDLGSSPPAIVGPVYPVGSLSPQCGLQSSLWVPSCSHGTRFRYAWPHCGGW